MPEESGEQALLLAAVADGMGGMPAGDEASRITIRAFFDSYPLIAKPPAARLRDALAHANHEVRVAVEANPTLRGMGSTLVAALFFEDRFRWLSVGDSLIFHWRGGELERINPLHNYGRELDARAARGRSARCTLLFIPREPRSPVWSWAWPWTRWPRANSTW